MKNLLLAALILGAAILLPRSWGLFTGGLSFNGQLRAAPAADGGLTVPLVSQYQGIATDNVNCGPASVAAMARAVAPRLSGTDGDVVSAARNYTLRTDGDTDAGDLERALSGFGFDSTALSADDDPGGSSDPIAAIHYVVEHGLPVLALVDGSDLGRGSQYGDHWLVITAVDSGAGVVRVMDPDTQPAQSASWQAGGIQWLPTAVIRSALRDASGDGGMVALVAGAGRTMPPAPATVLVPLAALLVAWEARRRILQFVVRRWRRRHRRRRRQ